MVSESPQNSAGLRKRIFLVDDHPVVRQGLRALIGQATDMEVCGEAANIQDALAAIERLDPDVVVVDVSLNGESGIDLIKYVHMRREDLPLLTLSMGEETIYAERACGRGRAAT